MAALQATSIAKAGNRYAPGGGTSAPSYFGGLSTHQLPRTDSSSSAPELSSFPPSISAQQQGAQGPSLPPNVNSPAYILLCPAAHQQLQLASQNMNPAAVQQQQQRRKQFLIGLGNVMLQRGVPLPPQLTGMPYPPGYDPSTSPWRSLEVSNADVGVFRLTGKDIDIFKLWALVLSAGGSMKVCT